MTKAPTKTKRLRRHGDAPANWQYRDGRPRWIPSPALRKAGWRARDLKGADGVFLSEGLSRDAARDINAAVAAWRRGELVAEGFAAMAPAGAAHTATGLPAATDRLSIGRLLDAYLDSREFLALRSSTRTGYKSSLKRLIDVLAGHTTPPDRHDPAAVASHALAVATIRASRVDIFQPAETSDGVDDVLYRAYWLLHDKVGKHQAYAVLAATSVWLSWCRRHQSRTIDNWAKEVRRDTPPGRIRPLTWPEIEALVRAADEEGLPSIGDAVVLGLDLSWSQADRLALTWPRCRNGRALTGAEGRQKTGRVGGTPMTRLGRARVAQILLRQRAMPARPTHVIWCEVTNAPWSADLYRKYFAKVRAIAARTCPSVIDARDQDLRDTAFTWMTNGGLDNSQIASRTLQSRAHIAQLGDKNYGEIGPEIADGAGRMFEAYLDRIGARL